MRFALLLIASLNLTGAEITFGSSEASSEVSLRARVGGDLAAPTIAAALPWRIGELVASSPVIAIARLEVDQQRIVGLRCERVLGLAHAIHPDGKLPILPVGEVLPIDLPAGTAVTGMAVLAFAAVVPDAANRPRLHLVSLPDDPDLPSATPLIASPTPEVIALVDRMVRLREAGVGMYRPAELFSPLTASLGIQPTAWDRRALVAWVRQAQEDAKARHPRPFGFAEWIDGAIAVARDTNAEPWLRKAMIRNLLGFASWATPGEISRLIERLGEAVLSEKSPVERVRLASVFATLTTGVNDQGDQARIARSAGDVCVTLAADGGVENTALIRILAISAARLHWSTEPQISAALHRLTGATP